MKKISQTQMSSILKALYDINAPIKMYDSIQNMFEKLEDVVEKTADTTPKDTPTSDKQ